TLVAIGISLPLGLAGLVLLARSRPQMATRAIVLVAIPAIAVLLGASISQLSTLVAHGVPTPLVRWLRYLPFLVLALCVPAGVAANALVTVLSRRARPVAVAAAVLVIVVVAGSTALASATVWREPAHRGLVCSRLPKDAATSGLGPAVASCSWRGQTWDLAPPATR